MKGLMFSAPNVIGDSVYLYFEQYACPALGLGHPSPVQASDVIVLGFS
jgi:hypothetical protein